MKNAVIALSLVVLAAGCTARRPILYPNQKVEQAGRAAADAAVDDCMRRAEEYVSSGRATTEVARDTAVGAGVGAAAGAAGGAVVGRAGTGAAVGAASGGAGSLAGSLFRKREASPAYKNFVTRCLSERGYDTIGWQ